MRLETGIVTIKGLAHVAVGVFTPWGAALAQWINSGEWPGKIIWIGVILPASVIGGGSSLLAFLSGAFTTYRNQVSDETTRMMRQATEKIKL